MEMYKKISLITDKDDMQDILDEFIDRFGEPPKETMALLKISLIRALASKYSISKIESKNQLIVFSAEKPELDIWSEIFGLYKGLSFRPVDNMMAVVYKTTGSDSPLECALKILTSYDETVTKNKEEI